MNTTLTTMAQVNRHRASGDLLYCAGPGYERVRAADVRFRQGAFQVLIAGTYTWIKPDRLWAEIKAAGEQTSPGLWDAVVS